MEEIKFRIVQISNDMCLIEVNDIRSIYRDIAKKTRGCICSLDVLLSVMEGITKEVEKLGNKAVFMFG